MATTSTAKPAEIAAAVMVNVFGLSPAEARKLEEGHGDLFASKIPLEIAEVLVVGCMPDAAVLWYGGGGDSEVFRLIAGRLNGFAVRN